MTDRSSSKRSRRLNFIILIFRAAASHHITVRQGRGDEKIGSDYNHKLGVSASWSCLENVSPNIKIHLSDEESLGIGGHRAGTTRRSHPSLPVMPYKYIPHPT